MSSAIWWLAVVVVSLSSALTDGRRQPTYAARLFNNHVHQGYYSSLVADMLFGGAGSWQGALECGCPRLVDPACGHDGTAAYTYANPCILNCSRKKSKKPDLKLDYMGPCCDFSRCPNDVRPICDTDGQMHQNECHFEYQQCVRLRKTGEYLGMNQSLENCKCNHTCMATEDKPVCDTLGKTHRNMCLFQNAKCFAKVKHALDIDVDYNGLCCDSHCQRDSSKVFPICDSTGSSYRDFCSFYVQKCKTQKKFGRTIRVANFGLCA